MPKTKPPVVHYDRGRIQPIDFIESWFSQPGFNGYEGYLAGNVIKYVARYPFKDRPFDDVWKAQTYLGWLVEHVQSSGGKKK